MKIIRISTDNEISLHDFPCGSISEQSKALMKLIGPQCDIYEHVLPKRLYTELMVPNRVLKEQGGFVSMLVDEEGIYHDLECNMVGSYLYETDKHGYPILGNVLFVGEKVSGGGVDFCGISPKRFEQLYQQLKEMIEKVRELS